MSTPRDLWTAVSARPWIALGILLALRLLLSVVGLSSPTLWMDEASSLLVAGGPLALPVEGVPGGLLDRLVAFENSPPLYFVLLRLWAQVSTTEPWLRLLSVLAGLVAVGAVLALARLLLPPGAALAGALLFALSPFAIDAAQSIRFYALATAATTTAAAAGLAWARRPRPHLLALHAAASLVALATFYPAGFTLGALSAVVLADLAATRRIREMAFWAGTQAAIALLLLPGVPLLLAQSHKVQEGFWARPPTLASVGYAIYPIAGGRPLAFALLALAVVALVRAPGPATRTLALLALPVVTQASLAAAGGPPFHAKFLVTAAPFAALLAGLGLAELPDVRLRRAATLLVAVLLARRLAGYYAGDFERFFHMRDAGLASALAEAAASKPGGTPLLHASVYSLFPAGYYVPAAGPHVLLSPPLPHYLLGRAFPASPGDVASPGARWDDAGPARAYREVVLVVHPSYPSDALSQLVGAGFEVRSVRDFGRPRPRQPFTPVRVYTLAR